MIKISVTHSFIDSGDVIFYEEKEFDNDRDSIKYLERIEQNKMQVIFNEIEAGKYSKSKIITNSNSVYSIGCFRCPTPQPKPLYKTAKANNKLKTKVTIERI
tara:strand:+ start:165 stop:470 length:306 start_codon:yes stop_codon:yes gene_type:complete